MKTFENHVDSEIKRVMTQKNYPCVAALPAIHHHDYWLKTYKDFGEVQHRPELRSDLLLYLDRCQEIGESRYFTFWAVFDDLKNLNEDEFELQMCKELSSLSSIEARPFRRDPDPGRNKFYFSLGGKSFFVLGLHPYSSRRSRRFPWPALVFNTSEQFNLMAKQPNPMVLLYSEKWARKQFIAK